MSQLLIRDVDPQTIKQLKSQAKAHNRTLQAELKSIVLSATKLSVHEARVDCLEWQKKLSGKKHSDSAALLREDRER